MKRPRRTPKRTITLTLTGKGWLLFCPVYLTEGWETSDELAPVARWHLHWLLSLAFGAQQVINWIVSFIDPNACGFWCWAQPMKPREIKLEVSY